MVRWKSSSGWMVDGGGGGSAMHPPLTHSVLSSKNATNSATRPTQLSTSVRVSTSNELVDAQRTTATSKATILNRIRESQNIFYENIQVRIHQTSFPFIIRNTLILTFITSHTPFSEQKSIQQVRIHIKVNIISKHLVYRGNQFINIGFQVKCQVIWPIF